MSLLVSLLLPVIQHLCKRVSVFSQSKLPIPARATPWLSTNIFIGEGNPGAITSMIGNVINSFPPTYTGTFPVVNLSHAASKSAHVYGLLLHRYAGLFKNILLYIYTKWMPDQWTAGPHKYFPVNPWLSFWWTLFIEFMAPCLKG